MNRQLASLCLQAYSGIPDADVYQTISQVCYGLPFSDGRALIFRGTDDIIDWFMNISGKKIDHAWGEVHRGFDMAWELLRKVIPDPDPATPLYLAGHSLGGALATMAAAYYYSRNPIRRVVTFGSPRAGNAAFRDAYALRLGDRTARYVNQKDPVPFAPPLLIGYRHVTASKWFDGTAWHDGVSCWRFLQMSVSGFIKDHDMQRYVEAMDFS